MKQIWYRLLAAAIPIVVCGGLYLGMIQKNEGIVIETEQDGQTEYEKEEKEEVSDRTDGSPGTEDSESGEAGAEGDQGEKYCVFVCGEVQKQGIYYVSPGARLQEAIDAAGGFTEDADETYWNLAAVIQDGSKIYVPRKGETVQDSSPQTSEEQKKVNLNTAGKEELMQLAGIGEQRAEDILAYRKKHGSFQSIEEIMQVPGIKESIFERIQDSIVVK